MWDTHLTPVLFEVHHAQLVEHQRVVRTDTQGNEQQVQRLCDVGAGEIRRAQATQT